MKNNVITKQEKDELPKMRQFYLPLAEFFNNNKTIFQSSQTEFE